MKRVLEILVFSVFALVLHVAAFANLEPEGRETGGASGSEVVSVAAASATVVDMVHKWESAPDVPQDQPVDVEQPTSMASTYSMTMPQIELPPARRPQMQVALAPLAEPEPIEADVIPPNPQPVRKPLPKPTARPPERPKQPVEDAAKAKQSSAARAEQRAAGRGGAAFAGTSSGAESTASAGREKSLKSAWVARIRRHLERNKRCPRNIPGTGKTVIRLTLSSTGKLLNYRVAASSGNAAFDQAAINAVTRGKRYPAAPKGLKSQQYAFTVPLLFRKCG